MAGKSFGGHRPRKGANRPEQLEKIASDAVGNGKSLGYRELSLRIHPWVCARCGRTFTRDNLSELTVHHKDHNNNNNPSDGSNWEHLCIYCHDNEHARIHEHEQHGSAGEKGREPQEEEQATYNPFAGLKSLLDKGRE